MKKSFLFKLFILFVAGLLILPTFSFAETKEVPKYTEASVHDPSVIKVDETYYVFGSHLGAAKTDDFMNWEQISSGVTPENPLFDNVIEELDEAFEWATKVSLWAPDVIQLDDGKFYMYYNAAEGTSPRSALGVAVADDVEGPYKDKGIFLKSGMWDQESEDGTIYNANIHPNAIDPHTFFDHEGKLWMVYGSYSGGIFILQMDPETGFALEGQGYGTKLMGGNHSRIEAPYIQYVPETGYYYLYTTFGGLDADGGYNIRVVRSENPDGPYVDAEGNQMIDVKGEDGSFFDDDSIAPYGVKLMGNYLFERKIGELGTGIGTGYVSPGHNSVYYNEETNEQLLIFHARFPERGEAHEVRVHQMFMNEDGWPVVAPYRYAEESLTVVDNADVIGEYKFVNHGKEITADIKKSITISLNEDGTVSGLDGDWELESDNSVVLRLDGSAYKGVFLEQWDPTSESNVMTFTALSESGVSVWGSKIADKSDVEIVNSVKEALSIGDTTGILKNLVLSTEGAYGTKISWESDNYDVITETGVIKRPAFGEDPVTAKLTAVITKNDVIEEKSFEITVLPKGITGLVAHYPFNGNLEDKTGQVESGTVTGDRVDNQGGSITFAEGINGGQAAVFDGESGIQLANSLISSNRYSVSLWLNPTELMQFSTTFFGAMTDVSWISLIPSGPIDQETMLWSGSDLGTGWYDASSGMAIPDNEWSNVAFTVDEGVISFYINGELKFQGEGFPDIFTKSGSVFSLGVNYWDVPYKGLMDELLVYNDYVLTDNQIANYYENGEIPNKGLAIDTSELEDLITESKNISNEDNKYTAESYAALQTAIQNVEQSMNNISSEDELNEALVLLQSAIDRLEEVDIEKTEVDTTSLQELIDLAKGISNGDGKYTVSSYNALQEAIKVAQSNLSTIKSINDLNKAEKSLQEAIDGLVKQVDSADKVDLTSLEESLEQAKKFEESKYTESSYQALQNAIEEAEKLLETIETEQDLESAIDALEKAISGLKEQVTEDQDENSDDTNNSDVDLIEDNGKSKDTDVIDGDGESLPKTATSMFTILLIGFILLIIGVVTFYTVNIRKVKE